MEIRIGVPKKGLGFHGGHRMNNAILREVIVAFAKMLINEKQTDEWGVTRGVKTRPEIGCRKLLTNKENQL